MVLCRRRVLHLDGKAQKGVDEVVRQHVRLQAQIDQLGALGVVVVLLRLNPGVGHALHLRSVSVAFSAECNIATTAELNSCSDRPRRMLWAVSLPGASLLSS